MDFQFVIPNSNSELLNSNGNNYFVKQVYTVKELPDLLKAARNAFQSLDSFYIFDHFDTFFSLIENVQSVQLQTMFRGSDLIYLTVDKLGKSLSTYLQNPDQSSRNSFLNLTKMLMFLNVSFIRAIDGVISGGDTKKNPKKQNPDYSEHNWDDRRYKIIVQIYNIFNLPLEQLWSLCIAEEEFVNMICDIGYRTLEHYSIKEKRVCDSVFQIFGTAIKRYNHALTFPVRMLQILKTTEIALAPAASGISFLYEEFGISTIFSVLLKEIIDNLSLDAADNQTSKFFSQFLMELGTISPKLMIPHLSMLGEELLNLDSYYLRNCILQIMGDVVTVELSSEDLSEEMKEVRDEFLEDLCNHIMDVSAQVRSKVLQIWNHMKTENSVPLVWQHKVLQLAAERLDDKATLVRKNAIQLIKAFLEMNPFAAKLSLQELLDKYKTEEETLQSIRNKMIEVQKYTAELEIKWEEMVPELFPIVAEQLNQNTQEQFIQQPDEDNIVPRMQKYLLEKQYLDAVHLVKQADLKAGNREERLQLAFEEQVGYYMALLKSYLFLQKDYSDEFSVQEQTVKFLEDSIEFAKIIAEAVPKIEAMLMSKINTDVFEAVDFFTAAYLFGIKGTECGMRTMLHLVWSGDKEKREAVTNAYNRVLFVTDAQGRAHDIKVVDNLCKFFEHISIGNFIAMEVLMSEWIANETITNTIIQVMFERLTQKLPDTSDNKARLALQLLIMASAAKRTVATANIDVIHSIGFGERGTKDPRIFAASLNFLSNLAPSNTVNKYYKRFDETNPTICKTLEIFTKMFFHPKINNFDNIAISTIDLIYHIGQSPDLLCQTLMINVCQKLKEISAKLSALEDDNNNGNSFVVPVFLLSRTIFLFGYVAMKEMIFLDMDVYYNMKYRQDLLQQNKNKTNKSNKRKTALLNMSASNALKRLSEVAAEPQQEPDEMLVGATAEDSIAELINHICEKEIMYSNHGIFPKFIPIVMEILKYPAKYADEELQRSACLALMRFMTMSSQFCDENMPFLMNILNCTKSTAIKCNIIVGLSDFTFRFPNIMQPWTTNIYLILHDKTDDKIRLTAVKMLSHLILHEMIRVKGQISDLCMCIIDQNEEIKNITRQFFKEISNKSNILYNVLPDIISRLSDLELNLEEEKYHAIMKYVIGLIQKDKHVESLLDKLCMRFKVTTEERQWRDIAFCMSLLSYNEKTIKKLMDNMKCYKDKVQVDEVYQCFQTIITNTGKMAKQEMKVLLEEFSTKLKECLKVKEPGEANAAEEEGTTSGTQENRRNVNDMPPPKKIPLRGRKVQNKKNGRPVVRRRSSSDSDDEFQQPTTSASAASRSSARKNTAARVIEETSSSSSEDEDNTSTRRNQKKKRL